MQRRGIVTPKQGHCSRTMMLNCILLGEGLSRAGDATFKMEVDDFVDGNLQTLQLGAGDAPQHRRGDRGNHADGDAGPLPCISLA